MVDEMAPWERYVSSRKAFEGVDMSRYSLSILKSVRLQAL